MGRTRIELLSSGDIDMYDDVSSPLTFAIADIRTPDKRDGNFSKTIKVPSTKGNDIRFGHIFDLNIGTGTYNPNRKAPCTLYIDDVPQITGYLQLLNIEVDDKNEQVYNLTIRGNVSNIFQTLGDDELTDLDFSSFDHVLNRVNQKASFTNTYTQGYCYPLIDYGFDNQYNEWKVEHILPAIFLRTYIDKIFSNAGFTYESTFFDSTLFKKLIIPCTGERFKYTDAQIAARLFEAGMSTSQTINGIGGKVQFNTDVSDPANAFNTATNRWTVPTTGYYNLIADINLNSSGTYLGSTAMPTYIEFRKNGSTTPIGQAYSSAVNNVASTVNLTTTNVYLVAGDYIEVYLRPFSASYSVMNWVVNTTSRFKNATPNVGLQAGDTVTMNNTVPSKIKQKDLLLDVIRMFNLYVDVDKNDSNRLLIETRDEFYSSGTTIDWTYKLDNSKVLEIIPMGDLDFKTFKYSYKEDKDYYNKKYFEDNLIQYGNREIEIENEFLKSTNETKVMFSPTPLVASNGDDKIIPKIFEFDGTNAKNKPFNIRLLYNGGTKTTNLPYTYIDSTVSTTSETTYLYAGHLDSPTAPTVDLNFAVPNELYYNTNIYTNANLFNLYHKRFLDEITDPDSKVVTGYFYLTPYDIARLDFRDTYYFEKQYFRLNKIYDYDPIGEQTTKCEFIKIKEGRSFSRADALVLGGLPSGFLGDSDVIDNKPTIATTVNVGKPRSTTILGRNNIIGSSLTNSYINGDENYVHGGNNINLLGSSGNIIYDGLENVTLINTSGTIVSESNTLYVNGYAITSGTIASLSEGWKNTPYSSSNFYDNGGGTWTVDSGDITTNKYTIIGKTMIWSVTIFTSTFSGSVVFPTLVIPNNKTASAVSYAASFVRSGATYYNDVLCFCNGTTVEVRRLDSSAFAAATNDVEVSFTITFEIQ